MTFCTARVAPEKAVFRPALPLHSQPGLTGGHMAKTAYWELLRDPRWQRKRLEVMKRDKFTCQVCYDDGSTLNVHHKHYFKGRAPWEYEDHELVTLCESCHKEVSEEEDARRKELFAKLNIDGPYCVNDALGILAGWANNNCGHDLSAFYDQSPYNFLLGEVLDYIDVFAFNIEALLEFKDALLAVDSTKRREALDEMVKVLRARGMD